MRSSVLLAVAAAILCWAVAARGQLSIPWLSGPPIFHNPAMVGSEATDSDILPAEGVSVLGKVKFSDRIAPLPNSSLAWLNENELAIPASYNGHTALLVYSGKHFSHRRPLVVAGKGIAESGTIVNMALNRTGDELALALSSTPGPILTIKTMEVDHPDSAKTVFSIPGRYSDASLNWLEGHELAVGLNPESVAQQPPGVVGAGSGGVYVIDEHSGRRGRRLELNCTSPPVPGQLVWSPNSNLAIGPMLTGSGLILIDRKKSVCRALKLGTLSAQGFMGWLANSSAILYSARPGGAEPGARGIFEYTLATDTNQMIAMPVSAAVFVRDGRIAVVGNRSLTVDTLYRQPTDLVSVDVGLVNPRRNETQVTALGIGTTATLLMSSSLSYSLRSDQLAVVAYIPSSTGPYPAIMSYNPRTSLGGLIATGRANATISLAWSPAGHRLAVLSVDAKNRSLTVIDR